MINLKKIIVVFFILLVLISGCKSKKDTASADNIRTGTEGIVLNFLPNDPPATIHVDGTTEFNVVLDVKNKGSYPQPGEGLGSDGLSLKFGKVFLGGYDQNIVKFQLRGPKSSDLSTLVLEGKSSINPNGGQDIISFTGTIDGNSLKVDKYNPTLQAIACYYYQTDAGPSVCIDPLPYASSGEKKVCQVHDIELNSQGAPIAVTRIDEEAIATKTQFRITIKNVGGGEALKEDAAMNKCDPTGAQRIEREDIDKVKLVYARIGNTNLVCGPFAEGNVKSIEGLIRLINGEGSIICELPDSQYSSRISAYTTPLSIQLSYGYRITTERNLEIIKERT